MHIEFYRRTFVVNANATNTHTSFICLLFSASVNKRREGGRGRGAKDYCIAIFRPPPAPYASSEKPHTTAVQCTHRHSVEAASCAVAHVHAFGSVMFAGSFVLTSISKPSQHRCQKYAKVMRTRFLHAQKYIGDAALLTQYMEMHYMKCKSKCIVVVVESSRVGATTICMMSKPTFIGTIVCLSIICFHCLSLLFMFNVPIAFFLSLSLFHFRGPALLGYTLTTEN